MRNTYQSVYVKITGFSVLNGVYIVCPIVILSQSCVLLNTLYLKKKDLIQFLIAEKQQPLVFTSLTRFISATNPIGTLEDLVKGFKKQ